MVLLITDKVDLREKKITRDNFRGELDNDKRSNSPKKKKKKKNQMCMHLTTELHTTQGKNG